MKILKILLIIGIILPAVLFTSCKKNNETDSKFDGADGKYTDSRDSQVYRWVKIGEQIWMAENLNYVTSASWWYANNPSNGNIYGGLYTWETALIVCPNGWHLPSDNEWKTLEMELGMSQSEADSGGDRGNDKGEKLKFTSGWNNNGNGTNSSGFSALPGGRINNGSFSNLGSYGGWWSSSYYSGSYAWRRYLVSSSDYVGRGYTDKSTGYSVRCIKNWAPRCLLVILPIWGIGTFQAW